MTHIGARPTRKGDAELIVALASGLSVRDAAKHAGVAERTAWRRLQQPLFRQEISSARSLMVSSAVGALAATATKAVVTLRALLDADSESVRLGAARAVLEMGPRLRESEELAGRVEALETVVQQREGQQRWGAA